MPTGFQLATKPAEHGCARQGREKPTGDPDAISPYHRLAHDRQPVISFGFSQPGSPARSLPPAGASPALHPGSGVIAPRNSQLASPPSPIGGGAVVARPSGVAGAGAMRALPLRSITSPAQPRAFSDN
ncbi:MAG TPA: hypothetical protein GYA08_01850 [Chloroflexi bacterium]|nr:hypothetical protein [Chloroflexota bacterium]